MMLRFRPAIFGTISVVLLTASCRATDPAGVKADEEESPTLKALQALGADVPGSTKRCNTCHDVDLAAVRRWKDLAAGAKNQCDLLRPLNEGLPPKDRLACLEGRASIEGVPYGPQVLRYVASGVMVGAGRIIRAARPGARL